jgi:mannose/fructose/N-acetylgalactosamine-specific phosphotransferase system component IIC
MFGINQTAFSIYVTQIPIALAILVAAVLMLHIKNVFIEMFNKQIEINKQNKKMLDRLLWVYENGRDNK